MFPNLPTPALLVDKTRLETNLKAMQDVCDAAGVQLRPHIKTHKCVEIARRQLELGAAGLTCAKLGEAEALLPAFEGLERREVFIAHSLVDPALVPRLQNLSAKLDDLILAVTSVEHTHALYAMLQKTEDKWPIMMAVDTGMGREGARGLEGALELARLIESLHCFYLLGIYSHEGHFYGGVAEGALEAWFASLAEVRMAVDKEVGHPIKLWPGCSVSAKTVAGFPGVDAVRPGAYVFGDLALTLKTGAMPFQAVALQVMATVVDKPEPGMALLDCGSKTLSSDKTTEGVFAVCKWGEVRRVSEEHGFLFGEKLNELRLGQRIRLTPAHVCPVVNLADQLQIVDGDTWLDTWRVAARGKVN